MAAQITTTPDASNQASSNGDVELVTEKFDDLMKSHDDIKHSALQESTNEVEIQTAQAGSELLSVKNFEELGLESDLLRGLYEMGFSRPSKIQEKALPLLLANPPQNMIGQSQSGTGKTAAFALTMLSRINYSSETTQAMCLAPTRELARQITSVIKKMGKYTKLTLTEAIKDGYDRTQKINSHLIVGTPGTLTDMIRKRLVDTNNVKIFVLDEADNMLDQQSLGDQSIRLKNMMPSTCQIVLFSATFSDQVRTFAERFAPNSNQFKLKTEELSVEAIKQYFMDCKSAEHKFEVLDALYTLLTIGQSIIFVQKRETADTIARRMTEMGHKVINIHGGLSPTERDQVMDGFRRGDAKVLITTNVLSRGIDVLQVNLVINYDLPVDMHGNPDYETYLHRIGRTGRFGRTDQIIITSPTPYQQFPICSTIPIAIKIQYEGLALLENVTLQTLDADTGKIAEDDLYYISRQDFDNDRAFNTTLFLDPGIYVPKDHDLATGIYTIHAIGDCTYLNTTSGEKQHIQIFKDVNFTIVNDANL
ncbi:6338_t:CDS:10 [Ambispora gerdemannii]|uniref:RNA helicase n=1 Tax=Ambispora gerdemannii TaxID=144530 RepID=A0A9N8VWU0_9GLOM|nr:6338_t:CDS:10 [Ambispora gerdemannii]